MSKVITMKKKAGVYEKETFTIRLLEDKDFDKLPYENISDSLGCAAPYPKQPPRFWAWPWRHFGDMVTRPKVYVLGEQISEFVLFQC